MNGPHMQVHPECLWPLGVELGEGPTWLSQAGLLYFVDISGQHIHCCDADGGRRRSWPAPAQVGFVMPLAGDGDFVVGLPGSLQRFSPASGQFSLLAEVETQLPRNRLNDAHVDAQGRLWFGTMDMDQRRPSGALYRLAADGSLPVQDNGIVITNGPASSPDGRTLYHTDTLKQVVHAFDISEDGTLSGKRELLRVFHGFPDGTTVDAEGHLWIAVFGGGRVERYTPAGRLAGVVPFPCMNVTKLAFGGRDLRTAFVTTARYGLSPRQAQEQPLAGGLFSFRVQTPGLPQHTVAVGLARLTSARVASP